MDLHEAWNTYFNDQQEAILESNITECRCPDAATLSSNNQYDMIVCAYQGVVAGSMNYSYLSDDSSRVIILLGSIWKPTVEISRSRISGLPLEVLAAMSGILNKYQILIRIGSAFSALAGWRDSSLKEWREARISQLDKWMAENQGTFFEEIKEALQKSLKIIDNIVFYIGQGFSDDYEILHKYLAAWFQDHYDMTINYEEGQIISFYEKQRSDDEKVFDLFPPMMFCKASSAHSRRYICSTYPLQRRGITLDHPFVIWLLDNAVQLKQYYQRQFQQIVDSLCNDLSDDIIQKINNIHKQLTALPEHHGVDVDAFPQLSMYDFWEE